MDWSDTSLPSYPRPQLVRTDWSSLELVEFVFDDADRDLHEGWQDGRALPLSILVPFPYQSARSGIDTKEGLTCDRSYHAHD